MHDNYSDRIVEVAVQLGSNIIGTIGKTGFYNVDFIIIALPYIVTASEIKRSVYLLKKAICTVADEFDYFIVAKSEDQILVGDICRSCGSQIEVRL